MSCTVSLNSYFFYFSPFHAPFYHPLFPWIMEPDEIASSEVLKVVINGSSDSRDLMVSHFLLRKHPDRQFHTCLCQYLLYQPKGSVGCPPLPGLGRGAPVPAPVCWTSAPVTAVGTELVAAVCASAAFPYFMCPYVFIWCFFLENVCGSVTEGSRLSEALVGLCAPFFSCYSCIIFFLQKKRRLTVWRKKEFSSRIETCQFSHLPKYLRGRKHAWRISGAVMLPGRHDLEKLGFDYPGCSTVSFRNTVSSSRSLLIAMWENGLLTVGRVFSLFLMLPFISKHCSISLSAAWSNICWRPRKNSWDPYTAGQQEPKHGF